MNKPGELSERSFRPELAARWIADVLKPSRVFVQSDPSLQAAIAAHGIAVVGRVDECDLAIASTVDVPALPCAMFVLMIAPHTEWRRWLDEVSDAGFRVEIGFDASPVSPRALLLRRDTPHDISLRDAVAGLLEIRSALAAREEALRRRTAELEQRLSLMEQAPRTAARLNLGLQDRLLITEAKLAIAQHERDVILNATLWKATAPLRRTLDFFRRRKPLAALRGPATDQGLGPDAYERWVALHDILDDADRLAIAAHIEQLAIRPIISVVMPAYETDPVLLRAAIASVRGQLYPHWQLCVADDASPSEKVADILTEAAAEDARIRWVRLPENGNISSATNAALALAEGEFVALMDHDDLLAEHALYEVVVALNKYPESDLIYSDEDQVDAAGRRTMPYFKPDFNIDLMLGHNMISHLGVYRRASVVRLGGARRGYEGSQDYDLALRVAHAAGPGRIHHIPRILYHWRQSRASFSKAHLETCVDAARRSITNYLQYAGEREAIVRAAPAIPTWSRVQYPIPDPPPLVSVIVPTRDRSALLRRCIEGVLKQTEYPAIELIIVDNDSVEPTTLAYFDEIRTDQRVRIMSFPGEFNFAAMNNAASMVASGMLLALVNNDIEVTEPSWLTEMVAQALRDGIGAVGARLLFPDRRIQHAGVVLGVGGFAGGPGVAGHFGLRDASTDFGYFGLSVLVHEVSAVTAACMVVKKSVYDAVGGMDAVNLKVAFNDVDFCLRLRTMGLRNLYTPYAELIHHESASRGDDLAPEHRSRFNRECRYMRERWGAVLDCDPFYNPNFSRLDGGFRLLGAPSRRPSWL